MITKQLDFKFAIARVSGKMGGKIYYTTRDGIFVRDYVKKKVSKKNKAQLIFSQAVEFWKKMFLGYKELYKKYSIVSTKGRISGHNAFVRDYVLLRNRFEQEEVEKIILKAMEIWQYIVLSWKSNAYKEASYKLAVKSVVGH